MFFYIYFFQARCFDISALSHRRKVEYRVEWKSCYLHRMHCELIQYTVHPGSFWFYTIDPLEEDRWIDCIRVANVLCKSPSTSWPVVSQFLSYKSCLKASFSIRSIMFFKKKPSQYDESSGTPRNCQTQDYNRFRRENWIRQ